MWKNYDIITDEISKRCIEFLFAASYVNFSEIRWLTVGFCFDDLFAVLPLYDRLPQVGLVQMGRGCPELRQRGAVHRASDLPQQPWWICQALHGQPNWRYIGSWLGLLLATIYPHFVGRWPWSDSVHRLEIHRACRDTHWVSSPSFDFFYMFWSFVLSTHLILSPSVLQLGSCQRSRSCQKDDQVHRAQHHRRVPGFAAPSS